MVELRRSKGSPPSGGTEFFISILMSLFAVGEWGVVRRRRGRRPRVASSTNRRRTRTRRGGGGCCGCLAILFLAPIIVVFGALIFFRVEISEIVYNLTGFQLPF